MQTGYGQKATGQKVNSTNALHKRPPDKGHRHKAKTMQTLLLAVIFF